MYENNDTPSIGDNTEPMHIMTHDEWFDKVGDLGRDFGKGQKTGLDFMRHLAVGIRDNAIVAGENSDTSKDDLLSAIDRINQRALRANAYAKQLPKSKVRLSEYRSIMQASAMPEVDFPAVLDRVQAEYDRKKKASVKRRAIDDCFVVASREQRKLTGDDHKIGEVLSAEQIDVITRKPRTAPKPYQQSIMEFHDRMVKVLKPSKGESEVAEEDRESFAEMLRAMGELFDAPITAEEATARAVAEATAAVEAAYAEKLAKMQEEMQARFTAIEHAKNAANDDAVATKNTATKNTARK